MSVFPNSLKNVAIFESDLSVAVELAVFELSLIEATVSLVPFELAVAVDEVVLE